MELIDGVNGIPITIDVEQYNKIFNSDVRKIVSLFQGYSYNIRIIGGAVRDLLLGRDFRDIDFVTDAEPTEVMFLLKREGISYKTSGISHGTVKILIDSREYDLSSLNFWIDFQDGVVTRSRDHSWWGDADRRDFTINSMSIDMDGKLWDYFGGVSDLRDSIIRSSGSFSDKIRKSPEIGLRFFRLMGSFKSCQFPGEYIDIIKSMVREDSSLFLSLDSKKVWYEYYRIVGGLNRGEILKLMDLVGLVDLLSLPGINYQLLDETVSRDPSLLIGLSCEMSQLEEFLESYPVSSGDRERLLGFCKNKGVRLDYNTAQRWLERGEPSWLVFGLLERDNKFNWIEKLKVVKIRDFGGSL